MVLFSSSSTFLLNPHFVQGSDKIFFAEESACRKLFESKLKMPIPYTVKDLKKNYIFPPCVCTSHCPPFPPFVLNIVATNPQHASARNRKDNPISTFQMLGGGERQ